ncbi:hypothetical protein CRG98_010191 [Punica granatum]|uniref:G-patch domain-containing protein n=1 Tax=Punica granatum TaxID=22663 RepID=A0A2I0KMA6_PUNGR|nr:hypothetical protein CRG98_010191 [Punica granatum]
MLQYWDYEQFVVATFQESLSESALNWFMSLQAEDIPSWIELAKKFVEQYQYNIETPRSFLELSTMEMAEGQKFEKYATDWRSEAAKHFPPICEAQQIQMFHGTLKGAYYSHLMSHKSSFSEMIIAGKPPASRVPQPAQQTPATQSQQSGTTQFRQRIQFTPLPTPLSHIYRQILAGDMIRPTVPGPSFVPANQDQSLHCEYHSSALGHTTDNCWKLREEVQKLINDKKISFNAIRAPNVQANPLPDHGSSSGPTINMISVCTMREDESQQEGPAPFVIEYVPAEATVGVTGSSAAPAPFIIEVLAREPYQDNKVPWTYEGSVGNLEQQFSVMGVTNSGRVYTNPEIAGKGKAPAASGAALEAPPISQKKVTEEEAEAFMKVIKASEYKGEEDYAIYKKTDVPYISIGDDENLPFHSFETISVIRDYGEARPSRADRMVGKVLLRHNYVPGTGLGAQGQGINCPIEIEEYKNKRGLGFRPSCDEIIEARRSMHLHHLAAYYGKINRGIPVPPLSHFFPALPHVIGGTLDGPFLALEDEPVDLSAICAVTEETPLGVHIRLTQENEELNNWNLVPRYSVVIADIEESLRRLENRQFTSVEPTKEFNVGTEGEPHILKIEMSLDPTQQA